jgi:hypothetical protein
VASKALQYGGNLTIPNLTKNDQGSYECVATNVVTSVIVTTLLLIEGMANAKSFSALHCLH